MIKQGNRVISNTQIKILASNEITKETIEKVLIGEISSHTHDETYVKKDDSRLSDARPASDVSMWAKNATKPSYSASEITGLSNVAKTGSYNDLSNKPAIPTVDVNKVYVDGKLATKADLVSGKIPLSQLPEISSPITVDSSLSSTSTNPVQNKVINTALENKVDKVSGKALSTNDYTTTEKNKLAGIATGANNYSLPAATASVLGGIKSGTGITNAAGTISVTYGTTAGTACQGNDSRLSNARPASDVSAWAKSTTKPSYVASEITGLASVAKTGSYNDLTNKPTIPTVDVTKAYVDTALTSKADLVSGKIPASQLPDIPSQIIIDSALNSTSTNPVQNKVINTSLENKVDKVSGKALSTNDYTTAEKNKLSRIGWIVDLGPSIEYEEDKIKFLTHMISPNDGSTLKSSFYINGVNSSKSGLMAASDKNKLDGIATGANNYIHPTTSGNKHIPSGGSSGQILRWSADGTAVWGTDNNIVYECASSSANGLMSKVTFQGLNDFYINSLTSFSASSASVLLKYTDKHPHTNISNAKSLTLPAATSSLAGVMTASDKIKLDGIATGANKYTLPVATSSMLGGVKTGANITNTSGTISVTKSNVTTALGYTPAEECLLIEYTGVGTVTQTITEAQFNDIWNAIKNNKTIKLKVNDPENNIYILYNNTGGVCYDTDAAICQFGGIMNNACRMGCTIFVQKNSTDYTLELHPIDVDLVTDGRGDRFLTNNGSYSDLPTVSTTQAGMVKALPDDATKFLDGKGNWSTVNTTPNYGVSDILLRIINADPGATVTQEELDTLIAATPEIDKCYPFPISEDLLNSGMVLNDTGFISRTTSNIDILLNSTVPGYVQMFNILSIDTTTRVSSNASYVTTIAPGNGELMLTSATVNGNDQTACGLTLKTKGDGYNFLNNKGDYAKPYYLLPYSIETLFKNGTDAAVLTKFGGRDGVYNFIQAAINNIPMYYVKNGKTISPVEYYVNNVAGTMYVITMYFNVLGINSDINKKCKLIFTGTNQSDSNKITISKSDESSIVNESMTLTLPVDFKNNTNYTSEQIGNIMTYQNWKEFYKTYMGVSTKTYVSFKKTNGDSVINFTLVPTECYYVETESNIDFLVSVVGYSTFLSGSNTVFINMLFSYDKTTSTYSLVAS